MQLSMASSGTAAAVSASHQFAKPFQADIGALPMITPSSALPLSEEILTAHNISHAHMTVVADLGRCTSSILDKATNLTSETTRYT